MQQAHDFLEECETLNAVLTGLEPGGWTRPTQFKGWTLNDVLVHLHFWNGMADQSLQDPAGFQQNMARMLPRMQAEGMRGMENEAIAERGEDLRRAWENLYRNMTPRWAAQDPKARVQWAGPDMSVRSSITARQMETWAHGQEVFDLLGETRPESDRIKNIVVLGVNTFGWSYKVHGRAVPEQMPCLELTAPSGALWTFGEADGVNRIAGSAVAFAQVMAQTRNVADTDLRVTGLVATEWMTIAQCFAGGPETPPPPGARHRVT
ncbi:TIGR03084 family protein [Seohaeicola saemankumensis]|nr:TIGR03084 family metal-binding protein [Seohaeicola saemankumensis]MCA0873260.1 TIGR03084 family protein [Seohaeicola saemankumensis]